MKKNVVFTGTWAGGSHGVKVMLPMILFEDGQAHIIYCPALDLSGYGETETKAKESFETVLSEYLLYTTHKNTFLKDLRNLGWEVKKGKGKLTPPTMADLLSNNENFTNIFNNYHFKKVNEPVEIPV